MKSTLLTTTAAVTLAASALHAGGIDRSGQGINILFEEGNFAQFSLVSFTPSVDGTSATIGNHSDVAMSYNSPSLGYKHAVSDTIDIAFIYDEPFGAHIGYTVAPLAGGGADINTDAITGLVRFKLNHGLSVYGGLRGVKAGGEVTSGLGMLEAESDYAIGSVVGVAYEKPEIALRAALTYASEITAEMQGFHNIASPRSFDVEFPESVNLDFQTGIAADTLLFGTIRWAGWDGFNLTTTDGEWVRFNDDTLTYSLGIGRQVTDTLSLAVNLGHEKSYGDVTTSPLTPTSGYTSLGIAATYQLTETVTVSGGLNYYWLGDTYYDAGGGNGVTFADNHAIGAGFRVGMRF